MLYCATRYRIGEDEFSNYHSVSKVRTTLYLIPKLSILKVGKLGKVYCQTVTTYNAKRKFAPSKN